MLADMFVGTKDEALFQQKMGRIVRKISTFELREVSKSKSSLTSRFTTFHRAQVVAPEHQNVQNP